MLPTYSLMIYRETQRIQKQPRLILIYMKKIQSIMLRDHILREDSKIVDYLENIALNDRIVEF